MDIFVVIILSRDKIYHFLLDIIIMFYYLHYMDNESKKFFLEPKERKHILYEALRSSFITDFHFGMEYTFLISYR